MARLLLHVGDDRPYGALDGCTAGTTESTAAVNCSSINNGYAWNHGYYAPEINNTWLGLVGPGVAHKGIDGSSAAEGPSSAGNANAGTELDTALTNPGTWPTKPTSARRSWH